MVVFCLLELVFSTNENIWANPQHFNASLSSWLVSISNSSRLSLFAASLPRMLHVVFCQCLPQPHPAYQTDILSAVGGIMRVSEWTTLQNSVAQQF
ncbi:hypothetical protein EPI10_020781 [Gossypium australe]|uniref:Uncharacterized protein n=1 Tax=Gossypium australe TaxID=47621 RepID=A0A5B6WF23_9ROSI|nr:hypothetical protein EPI10_020781 [Gossypium australe]